MNFEYTKPSEKDLTLISRLNWDYDYSETELYYLIKDNNNFSKARLCFFIKSLETYTWQELIYLWGLDECNKLYTEEVRKGIFSDVLREEYDGIFSLLRNKTISFTKRSPEELERFKATLLFNRRNRIKQGLL